MRLAPGTTLKEEAPSLLAPLAVYLLAFLVVLSNVYGSKSSSRQKPVASLAANTSPLDTCGLIQNSEIESVQGLPVQQTQPTLQKRGDLNISQCYYTAISADGSQNLSVYVQVIQRNPESVKRGAVKEFWEKTLERERGEKKSEEKDEDEAINPPMHVSGVGDEAFWLGSNRGGALYVLKNDKVVRVTVGGTNEIKTQIEKSKTLAKKALARLG